MRARTIHALPDMPTNWQELLTQLNEAVSNALTSAPDDEARKVILDKIAGDLQNDVRQALINSGGAAKDLLLNQSIRTLEKKVETLKAQLEEAQAAGGSESEQVATLTRQLAEARAQNRLLEQEHANKLATRDKDTFERAVSQLIEARLKDPLLLPALAPGIREHFDLTDGGVALTMPNGTGPLVPKIGQKPEQALADAFISGIKADYLKADLPPGGGSGLGTPNSPGSPIIPPKKKADAVQSKRAEIGGTVV